MRLQELEAAFLQDHRRLSRGLDQLLRALEAADLGRAVDLARRLDHDAGPHMAFEEEVFYPRLAETRGQEFVDGLVREHAVGQRAIQALLQIDPAAEMETTAREQLIADVRLALGHVLSCGTLLSEIHSDEPRRDERELETLKNLRRRGERWSLRSYPDLD